MRKTFTILTLFFLLILSCTTKTNPLSNQLKTILESHLKAIDSLAVLDSVHILTNVPLTEKLARIIDDSAYAFMIRGVKVRLAKAEANKDLKEMEKYHDEINYMSKAFDSVSKSIESGDTTRKSGRLIQVSFTITRNQITKLDSTVFFIDSASRIMYPTATIVDMSLQNALKK